MVAKRYDDVLVPFLALMRKELHANSRKGDRPGWLAMDANTALLEVYWHAAKLSAAVKNNDGPAIMEHSADVANMAMMVLDICGGLAFITETGWCTSCGCGNDAAGYAHTPLCRLAAAPSTPEKAGGVSDGVVACPGCGRFYPVHLPGCPHVVSASVSHPLPAQANDGGEQP